MSKNSLIFLQFNEVCFEFIEKYIAKGKLNNFNRLINLHGVSRTSSENEYKNLEPWIQWVSIHSGKKFKEHNIFRLGDISKDIINIWDELDKKGINSCLISPMNALNPNLKNSLFIPDPWTDTTTSKGFFFKLLHKTISSMINDNAKKNFKLMDLFYFLIVFFRFTKMSNYLNFFFLFISSFRSPWRKAIFLDLFLFEVFINVNRKRKFSYSSIFLNAAAHIQHHYFYSSSVYEGNQKNPDWYCPKGLDPLLEIYEAYDEIIGKVVRIYPETRIIIATGLSQTPTKESVYYWRLKNHSSFLKELSITFEKVEPRMSRDFLISFSEKSHLNNARKVLNSFHLNGQKIFEIDKRDKSLFVTLSYKKNIPKGLLLTNEETSMKRPFFEYVSLVALKNGHHNQEGYFIDSMNEDFEPTFEIEDIFKKVTSHFI